MGEKHDAKVRLKMAEGRNAAERSLGVVYSAGLVLLGFLEPDNWSIAFAVVAGLSYLFSLQLSSYVVELELIGYPALASEVERLRKTRVLFRKLPRLDWSWVPMINIITFGALATALILAAN